MADLRIALAGNPNTGKSTLFNVLTGLNQHTGNWAGKTVSLAEGSYEYSGDTYTLLDLPGTYSLYANSEDEEVARDAILFGKPDATVVVVDATALERNLNLALQIMEMAENVILCINLIDEAEKKGIFIDEKIIRKELKFPVVKVSARNKLGLETLKRTISLVAKGSLKTNRYKIPYSEEIEQKIKELEPEIQRIVGESLPSRWIAVRLIDGDKSLADSIVKYLEATGKEAVV